MAGTGINRFKISWNKEIQRDILALGSPVFYFLTVGRALVGPFWDLLNPLIVLAAVVYAVSGVYPLINLYIARGIVLATLVTRHYNDIIFGVFALVALVMMIMAALSINNNKTSVVQGVWLGIVLSLIAYPIAVISDTR